MRRSNPLQGQERAQRAGAKLFARECAVVPRRKWRRWHWEKLRRFGKKKSIDAPPGALFWILRNGSLNRGMPSFAHLPEPQRWQIITWLTDRSGLHEVVFDFVEDAFFGGLVFGGEQLAQLLEELALLAREFGRDADVEVHEQIAAAAAVDVRHARVP